MKSSGKRPKTPAPDSGVPTRKDLDAARDSLRLVYPYLEERLLQVREVVLLAILRTSRHVGTLHKRRNYLPRLTRARRAFRALFPGHMVDAGLFDPGEVMRVPGLGVYLVYPSDGDGEARWNAAVEELLRNLASARIGCDLERTGRIQGFKCAPELKALLDAYTRHVHQPPSPEEVDRAIRKVRKLPGETDAEREARVLSAVYAIPGAWYILNLGEDGTHINEASLRKLVERSDRKGLPSDGAGVKVERGFDPDELCATNGRKVREPHRTARLEDKQAEDPATAAEREETERLGDPEYLARLRKAREMSEALLKRRKRSTPARAIEKHLSELLTLRITITEVARIERTHEGNTCALWRWLLEEIKPAVRPAG